MADYVGDIKTEAGLETALEKVGDLESKLGEVKAGNYHELMRVAELKDLLLVGKLVARAALERRESRMGSSHMRGDYPETDNDRFHGSIILRRGRGDTIRARFEPAPKSL